MSAHQLQGLHANLVTLHNKLAYIGPDLEAALGWTCHSEDSFNTDVLGTFSGEAERTMSAQECAVYKAQKALSLCSADIGLGSEGSFSPDPFGLVTLNTELVACVHKNTGLLAIGQFTRPVDVKAWTLAANEKAQIDAIIAQLPKSQAVILRTVNPRDENTGIQYGKVYKGLYDITMIHAYFDELVKEHPHYPIELSFDLRAMHCPVRQETIRLATHNLIQRLNATCPACSAVDFFPEKAIPGLICSACALPTGVTKGYQAQCKQCGFKETIAVDETSTSPVNCDICNP